MNEKVQRKLGLKLLAECLRKKDKFSIGINSIAVKYQFSLRTYFIEIHMNVMVL